jgi:hypothetical protein
MEKLGDNAVRWVLTYAVMRERDRRHKPPGDPNLN